MRFIFLIKTIFILLICFCWWWPVTARSGWETGKYAK